MNKAFETAYNLLKNGVACKLSRGMVVYGLVNELILEKGND